MNGAPALPGLPSVVRVWRRDADVVVVGSGAAGISTALTLAAFGVRVLVVTKDLGGGATPLAQGGLAAALAPDDATAAHVADTLVAGAGLCSPEAVERLAAGAPEAVEWLITLGARLETARLRLEGGHGHHRIVHSGDDATGAEVHRALLAALLAARDAGAIEVLDRTVALDLVAGGALGCWAGIGEGQPAGNAPTAATVGAGRTAATVGGGYLRGAIPAQRVTGIVAAMIEPDGALRAGVIHAPAVVIAAGGLGQAFATTSNPAGATGDGIALAARAGAVIRDLEFVQFHPTVLWLPGASGQCPLITEALRGAGAVLRDLSGAPLMAGHDPRGDLAPRDVVAARMASVIASGSAGHVWLDATGLGADLLENGFPTVTAGCRKHGIDPVTSWIPVAPGAHYSCGGILADLDGRTGRPGLYAVGEAASTGVQGANRLASNSVTEAVIAGRRAGAEIARALAADTLGSGDAAGSADPVGRGTADVGRVRRGVGRDGKFLAGDPSECRQETPTRAVFPSVAGGERSDRLAMSAETRLHHSAATSARGGTAATARTSEVMALAAAASRRLEIAAAMARWAGVMRDGAGLAELVLTISKAGDERAGTVLDLGTVEAVNLRTVSMLIAVGALRRAESRGCHRRSDAAGTAAEPWHTLLRWDGARLLAADSPVTTDQLVRTDPAGTTGGSRITDQPETTDQSRIAGYPQTTDQSAMTGQPEIASQPGMTGQPGIAGREAAEGAALREAS